MAASAAIASVKPGRILAMSAWSGKIRGGSALLTEASDTWKRRCFASCALLAQRLEHEVRVDGVAGVADAPAGIAEAHAFDAVLDLEQPAVAGVARKLALDAVLVGGGMAHGLKLGMAGQHLIVDAADPMPPRADLAVGHGLERRAERAAEIAKHLLDGVERNAADQQGVRAHASSCLFGGSYFIPPPLAQWRAADVSASVDLSGFAQSASHQPREPRGKRLGVGRTLAVEHAGFVIEKVRGVFLEGAVAVAKARQRHDQVVARIDLQHRFRARYAAAGAREQLFQRAVRPALGRDEADRTVGEAVGGAHVGHGVAQRELHKGDETGDRLVASGRLFFLLVVEQRDQREIRRALGRRAERLAVERRIVGDPEAVDDVGQQQHLDAAGAEAFEMRRASIWARLSPAM